MTGVKFPIRPRTGRYTMYRGGRSFGEMASDSEESDLHFPAGRLTTKWGGGALTARFVATSGASVEFVRSTAAPDVAGLFASHATVGPVRLVSGEVDLAVVEFTGGGQRPRSWVALRSAVAARSKWADTSSKASR